MLMQKVVSQHVLEQRMSKDEGPGGGAEAGSLHAIFKAKRLNSPFALIHFRGEIAGGESLILCCCRCRTRSCCLPSPCEAGFWRTCGARCTSGQPPQPALLHAGWGRQPDDLYTNHRANLRLLRRIRLKGAAVEFRLEKRRETRNLVSEVVSGSILDRVRRNRPGRSPDISGSIPRRCVVG